MKSVEKCKSYSAFYPEQPQLHRSLAFVYRPVFTSPRLRRVDTRSKGQWGVYVLYTYMSTAVSTATHLHTSNTDFQCLGRHTDKTSRIQCTESTRMAHCKTGKKCSVKRWTLLAQNVHHLGYVAEEEEPSRQLFILFLKQWRTRWLRWLAIA